MDQNEIGSVHRGLDIRADVRELEIYLIEIYQNILTVFTLFDDLVGKYDYNTTQMMI